MAGRAAVGVVPRLVLASVVLAVLSARPAVTLDGDEFVSPKQRLVPFVVNATTGPLGTHGCDRSNGLRDGQHCHAQAPQFGSDACKFTFATTMSTRRCAH